LEIAEERGDIDFKALSLIHLGSVYHSLKKYAEAIEYNRSGLEIGRKIGSKEIEAKALKNLGLFYSSQKQYDLALDYHHHSLVISSQTGDVVTEVQSLLYIGVNYRYLGEYQQALLFLEQGIEIAHQSDNRKLKANIAEHLYVTLIRLKEQSVQQLEAIAAYKKAHELFQDIGLDNYAQMCADFNEPA
jgi:tetratricopeptide (TPR) repeat protein